MTDYLFVYGSLLSKLKHPMALTLQKHATLLGEAKCSGRLYRIAWYPGLVASTDPAAFVLGELYQILNPKIFSVLDEYEGINPDYPTEGEYQRVHKNVIFRDTTIEASVYLYQGQLKGLRRIKTGDFLSDLTAHFE